LQHISRFFDQCKMDSGGDETPSNNVAQILAISRGLLVWVEQGFLQPCLLNDCNDAA